MYTSSMINFEGIYIGGRNLSPRKADFRGDSGGAATATRARAPAAWHRVGTGDADGATRVCASALRLQAIFTEGAGNSTSRAPTAWHPEPAP